MNTNVKALRLIIPTSSKTWHLGLNELTFVSIASVVPELHLDTDVKRPAIPHATRLQDHASQAQSQARRPWTSGCDKGSSFVPRLENCQRPA